MEATITKVRLAPAAKANIDLSQGLTQVSAASWPRTTFDTSVAREKFDLLAEWWHDATDAYGSPSRRIEHKAYLKIIDAGKEMVPYIIEDLRDRGGDWYSALRRLTGKNPVRPQHVGRVKDMKNDWLSWWTEEQKKHRW